jgi:hypothetical protein
MLLEVQPNAILTAATYRVSVAALVLTTLALHIHIARVLVILAIALAPLTTAKYWLCCIFHEHRF